MNYEDLKKEWEKSPLWTKWGIIGACIGILISVLTLINFLYSLGLCKLQINIFCSLLMITISKVLPLLVLIPFGPIISILNSIFHKIELSTDFSWIIISLVYIICWFLLGSLIGLIASKLKSNQAKP